MNPVLRSLPVVVLLPHSRCNCRCLMCDIWKDTKSTSLSLSDLDRLLDDFQKLSVEWVVLSGGEPLMHPHLFEFCAKLRERCIQTTLLSTGLLFERYAPSIVETVTDAIVSLDGPPAIHDQIRRVQGAYSSLARGVQAVHKLRPAFPVSARSTVQRGNYRFLTETARTAKMLGLKSISFLAADVISEAFNRPLAWDGERQSEIALTVEDIHQLESEIETLISDWAESEFIAESPDKLRRIVLHYRAHLGLTQPLAPQCNAPWVSTVIEATGAVRPCFFHAPIGHLGHNGLVNVLNGPAGVDFRSHLNVAANPTCQRCVCSLHWKLAS
jgi:MoaA/NifB/PqqE/SkfB family radical SAM enzyme